MDEAYVTAPTNPFSLRCNVKDDWLDSGCLEEDLPGSSPCACGRRLWAGLLQPVTTPCRE